MAGNNRPARTAIVVGGGIGGLATGMALLARGWRVQVLERAAMFGEVGAGLSLWPNGVRALSALGLGDQVLARALVETEAGIRDTSGRWMSRTDTEELARQYGPLVMIHRADLFDILRKGLPDGSLHAGTTVTDVRTSAGAVEVRHGGGVLEADLVVGADGIRSVVRKALWEQDPTPRYVGYTAWRLVADPGERLSAGGETWGRGERVGLAPLPDGRTYMFGVANAAEGERSADGELAELRRRFGRWHSPIPALLDAADEHAVMRHDVYELPPLRTFVSGRVALVGDAAHAMTPNMGQGANQALEDALTLAALLDEHGTVPEALTEYDRTRRPRTQKIAQRSARIGSVAQWASPLAAVVRDLMMRLTPSSAMRRSLHSVLSWTPPT
ncbi:FAD-dependent monooxygenase [Phytoactinopolyspora endophytica]|uniref:FAD-dependent monooxygenase n=1 Tax=Phytoactinopolyspora endophytica TaxID=1642495 RepID=UPI00101D0E11|nr:FAD-dependent monooxygenase [Phytoactinopolyspora endophytica]